MQPAIRLADPPREIPSGLNWLLLAQPATVASLMLCVIALTLVMISFGFPTAPRLGLLILAATLLYSCLRAALPAMWRAAGALGFMKDGFMTVGRIVSCRLAWDKGKANTPYAQFLPNWLVEVGKSEVDKAYGCFMKFAVLITVVPFLMAAAIFTIMLAFAFIRDIAIGTEAFRFTLIWIAGAILVSIGVVVVLRKSRQQMGKDAVRYMEWRKLTHPGPNDMFDGDAERLVREARKAGKDLSLREPLPKDYSGVELICQVEYSLQGGKQMGEGRVRLCDRLDPAGVEPLLFHPGRPAKVVFMAGLPAEVRVDLLGQWQDAQAAMQTIVLVFTGLAAGGTLVGIAAQAPWILSVFSAP